MNLFSTLKKKKKGAFTETGTQRGSSDAGAWGPKLRQHWE